MKIVKFKKDGKTYGIPALYIAQNRANKFAKNNNLTIGGKEWEEMVKWILKNNLEIFDWLLVSTRYEDWEDYIFLIEEIPSPPLEWDDFKDLEITDY